MLVFVGHTHNTHARRQAICRPLLDVAWKKKKEPPPKFFHVIGAGKIRLTGRSSPCLLWQISLPNAWQECHVENSHRSDAGCQPRRLTSCVSDRLQVLSIASDCSSCQSADSNVSLFPRKQPVLPFPFGSVRKCHFSLDFTVAQQPCTAAPLEGFLSSVCGLAVQLTPLWRGGLNYKCCVAGPLPLSYTHIHSH